MDDALDDFHVIIYVDQKYAINIGKPIITVILEIFSLKKYLVKF